MALTNMGIRSLKPKTGARKYSDGGGSHLLVTPQGSKLWRLAYRFDGRQKALAIGVYPTVTLADARKARDQAKKTLRTAMSAFMAATQRAAACRFTSSTVSYPF